LCEVNIGRKVTVSAAGGKDNEPITGTILAVTETEDAPEQPSPYVMDVRRPQNRSYYSAGRVVLVKTETSIVALNAGTIQQIHFFGDDVKTDVARDLKRPTMRLELEKAAGGKEIELSYLSHGITWVPSYLIDLSDNKTARLSAKAIIVNETVDLENIELELVTGFPNIKFGDVNSPVAMSQTLSDFLNAFASGRSASRGRNSHMLQQQAWVANYADYGFAVGAPMAEYATAEAGTVAEDLFLYPIKNFSLKKNETVCVPLFTARVPYKHIYTWKIDDSLDSNEHYNRATERDGIPDTEEVWHCCRLSNNMKMPWTTASAEFVKDGQFTGQDVCYYTAPGTETTIRINRAMNVLAEEAEFEVERKRNAATFHGYRYDLVKVRGELKLRNRLDTAVDIEVTKDLSGEVLSMSPKAKDIPTAKGLKRVNPRHILVWNIELKAGSEETVTYTYEVYVRN
jgi:hypothetical protein